MTKADAAMQSAAEPTSSPDTVDRPAVEAAGEDAASAGKTVTRVDLAEAVYRQVGLSRKESAALVEMVLAEVTEKLVAGETVKLSSFGSFIVRAKGERVGRNPKTGVEVPIQQRRVLVFKSSNVLRAQMNGEVLPRERA